MESITIGEIADIYSGYAFRSKDLYDEPIGIPVIKIGNLVGSEVDYSTTQYIQKQHALNIQEKYYLKDKDILIAMTGQGSVGRVSQLRKKNPDDVLLLNQRVGRIVVDPQKADRDFIFFLLSSKYYQDYLFSAGYGSGQPNLSPDTIKNVTIPNIELNQQKRISSILSAINDKIETNKVINQNLYDQLTVYYKHLFSNQSEIITIGDLSINVFSGGTPSTSNETYWNGDYYWLSSGETSDRFIPSTIKTITTAGIENSSTRKAEKYDIVIASAGQGHTRGQTSMLLTDSYVNQSIIVVHASKEYLPFLFWNISNRYEELRVISNSNSIRGSLTTKMINSLSISKVSNKDIRTFSEYAWPIIYSIENNTLENIRLTSMRNVLLPKLMSGELDVSKVEV